MTKQRLKQLWKAIPFAWREEAKSFTHTFCATLILSILLQLQSGDIPAGKDALLALATAALRSALKAGANAVLKK